MRTLLSTLLAAGVVASLSGAALAQGVNVQIGPGDRDRDRDRDRERVRVDVDEDDRRSRREVIEERGPRRSVIEERGPRRGIVEERIIRRERPVRTVCRPVERVRVRPNGVVVRRTTQECRTVVGGRRF